MLTLLTGASAVVVLALAETRTGDLILYNHSPSMPVGFYVRVRDAPRRASIVTVRAAEVAPEQAAQRGFDGRGDRFIKRVAAVGGDIICAQGDTVEINGRPVAERRETDSEGRALPRWHGCRTLSADQYLLLGDTADSFDGRYWGPVDRSQIEGVWRPL